MGLRVAKPFLHIKFLFLNSFNLILKKTYSQLLIVFVAATFFMFSCVSSKNITYFNNLHDTTFNALAKEIIPVLQKNDLLSISVSSLNPDATIIFNTPNLSPVTSSTVSGSSAQMTGYLIDQDGKIQFPILGNIQTAGLTKKQLENSIAQMLVEKKLLFDPIVSVRLLNFRVTVLGEVARPTVVTVPDEKMSILEAVGLAGDLTIYAKRDNVLLIREENGTKVVKRLDLNSIDIFSSPYYYLKTNDIIYVEPGKAKLASTSTVRQILPLIFSGLSLLAILLDRIIK